MPLRIEDYALIGDTRTAALVGADGSIDWLCVPRFDAPACFAALLGTPSHGRWLLAPAGDVQSATRAYAADSLVLHTEFATTAGRVRIVDCMPPWPDRCDIVRVVEGLDGEVDMEMELIIRPSYGALTPWVRRIDDALLATGGPDSLQLRTTVDVRGRDLASVANFAVRKGDRVPFVLSWFRSHETPPLPVDADAAIAHSRRFWQDWCSQSTYKGIAHEAVKRSLIVLKALTYAPTGGMVAAATTSLPEHIGSVRNWDYRYCWVRDSTFTLYALLLAGYRDEAREWRRWLLRAAAGHPRELQILYGVAGERQLTELTLPWLPGYEGSAPVRVGNAASVQFQLDIYGELLDTMHVAREAGLDPDADAWTFQRTVVSFLGESWHRPDHGIWEMRGPPRHYTFSKVMAWVAFDRAVKAVENFGLHGPVERWRHIRERIHEDVCARGFDAARNTFVQRYDAADLDASLLLLPQLGFLPAHDPRIVGTVEAVERELVEDGLARRYPPRVDIDGLPPGEGYFLPCSFWLADALYLIGRRREARRLFDRLLALRNDVGLLSEEYDVTNGRALGNMPQALTHVALVNTARNLSSGEGPAKHRARTVPEKRRQPPAGATGPRPDNR